MPWLPIALRYIDLLIKYGPSAWAAAVEVYKLIEAMKKAGQTPVAEARKLALDYELAQLKAMPRQWRSPVGIKNVRDGARKEYAKAMGLV